MARRNRPSQAGGQFFSLGMFDAPTKEGLSMRAVNLLSRALSVGMVLVTLVPCGARAQGPAGTPGNVLPEPLPGEGSSLGPAPGAGMSPFQTTPGGFDGVLGGRPGTSTPRAPASLTQPGAT